MNGKLPMQLTLEVLLLVCAMASSAQAQFYAGVAGGISTLSGDARSLLQPGSSSFSSYNPENGPAVEALLGRHLSNYFTVQADYIWNRNALTVTSAAFTNGTQEGEQELRRTRQQSVIGDVLVYFHKRNTRLRPYLAVGTGFVHLISCRERLEQLLQNPVLPQECFSANRIVLHVPVGIDVNLGKGWAFRYAFSETLSKNPLSDRLSPPGQHSLKNFQNLFGLIKRF